MENKINQSAERSDGDALVCIYKNAHVALQAISGVMKETDDLVLKQQLAASYDGYEKLIGEISTLMAETNVEPKEPNIMKKAMIWSSSKMNAMMDNSVSHIAEMLLQGTVTGIGELRSLLTANENTLDERVREAAENLLAYEEEQEEAWKKLI